MHRNTLWLIFAILCIYFSLILCHDSTSQRKLMLKDSNNLWKSDLTALQEEARIRKRHRHHLFSWGFYGLAIAYLIKVKVVVVAFFVGSAIYLGLRYLWPHKCADSGIYKEGSIVLDHPPSFAHHDHVPYSLDQDHYHSGSFASSGPSSFEPYSAYSSHTLSDPASSFPSSSFSSAEGPPESLSLDIATFRRKRSVPKDLKPETTGLLENLARQINVQEEQIGDFMLNFLGLDSAACRRRFICEMEFKSKANPLTSMAFRVIGRSFFAKYNNNQNPFRKASSFDECAVVNVECVFIENNEQNEVETQQIEIIEDSEKQMATNQLSSTTENNESLENLNEQNLQAELSRHALRKRLRGDRYLKLI